MNGVIHTVAWGDCMYERLYERQQQFEMVNETCVYEKRISIVDWFSTLGVFPQTSIEIKAHNIDKRKPTITSAMVGVVFANAGKCQPVFQ